MDKAKRTEAGLKRCGLLILVLLLGLSLTVYAILRSEAEVKDNTFSTGKIDINLNDGVSVITEEDLRFEPGATVRKTFFLENDSTWEVYSRLYLSGVRGGLERVVEITIACGEEILYSGPAMNLNREKAVDAGTLAIAERREYTITLHFPEEAGNTAQEEELYFTLCADAVQSKNNPGKEFE